MGSDREMIFSSSGAICSIRFDDWDDTRSPDMTMPPIATAIINASVRQTALSDHGGPFPGLKRPTKSARCHVMLSARDWYQGTVIGRCWQSVRVADHRRKPIFG